jgi:DNA-binding NarL/FixJ family response regulator
MQHHLSEYIEDSVDLGQLWHRLCDGRLFVVDTHCAEGRCFAVLEARSSGRERSRRVQIVERVFEGESQQALACELGVSVATVATHCTQVLNGFIHRHWVSRAPIMLTMAALAARGAPLGRARCDSLRDDGRWVISVEIPGQTFRDRLSRSELEVARLSIEGKPHAVVAVERGTSVRTVANQLASVFAKLKVSGRAELRAKAVREYAAKLQSQAHHEAPLAVA